MKKIISILMLICAAASFASCKKEIGGTVTATATKEQITQPQKFTISAESISNLKEIHSLNTINSATCKWNLGGRTFWLVSFREAKLYDGSTFEEIANYDVSENGALYNVSPDGIALAYSLKDEDLILYDVLHQKEIRKIHPDFYYSDAKFSPNGKYLAVISMEEIQIHIWDVDSGKEFTTLEGFETAAPVYSGIFGEDNKTFLWLSRGTVQPMDIKSKTMGPAFSHEDFVSSMALSPDGKILATAAAGTVNGKFTALTRLWNAKTGDELAYFTNADSFSSLTFSPDGSILAAGTNKLIIFWNTIAQKQLATVPAGNDYINSLAFSPDGTQLVSCSADGIAKIWKIVK